MKPSYTLYARPNRKDKRNRIPIYLRITFNHKTRYVSTCIKLEEKHWNESKEEVRKSHPAEKVYNEELRKLRLKAQQNGFDLERKNRISAKNFVEHLKRKSPTDFVKLTEKYIKRLKNNGSVRLSKQTNVILNKVKAFSNSEVVEFGEITQEFLNDMQQYLRVECKNHQNTIRKDYERLKRVFDDAEQKELLSENLFNKYTLQARQKTKKEALTFEQIKDIERLKLDTGSELYHV